MGQVMAKVLWVEDKQSIKERTMAAILKERGFDIDWVCDGAAALKRLSQRSNGYRMMLLDLKMEPMDGFEVFYRARELRPTLPVVIVSGFVDEHPWRDKLPDMKINAVLEKPWPISASKDFEKFVGTLHRIAEEGVEYIDPETRPQPITVDPFEYSFSRFMSLEESKALELRRRAWETGKEWVLSLIRRRNLSWVFLCGGILVSDSASSERAPSQEEMERKAAELDRIPFMFFRPPVIEDTTGGMDRGDSWTNVGRAQTEHDDFYPAFRILLETTDAGRKVVVGDFDTGADRTHLSDGLLRISRLWTLASGHFRRPYKYYSAELPITVIDDYTQDSLSCRLWVAVVKDWETTAFVEKNPQRIALIGRDVLGGFPLRVALDSLERKTFVQFMQRKEE